MLTLKENPCAQHKSMGHASSLPSDQQPHVATKPPLYNNPAPDSHTHAVRRVLYQYLKRQTRKRVNNVPGLYLTEMIQHVDEYDQFVKLFKYWVFAAKPVVSSEFAEKSLAWISRHRQSPKHLVQFVYTLETLSKPVFEGGDASVSFSTRASNLIQQLKGGAKLKQPAQTVSIALLTKQLDYVLLLPHKETLSFPGGPIADAGKSAETQARTYFRKQTGLTIQTNFTFLGERTSARGDMILIYRTNNLDIPAEIVGKQVKWTKTSKLPETLTTPDLWNIVFQSFPLNVRHFAVSKPRRVLLVPTNMQQVSTLVSRLRRLDVVYILLSKLTKKYKMYNTPNLAHPMTMIQTNRSVSTWIHKLNISVLMVDSCDQFSNHGLSCAELQTQFPDVSIVEQSGIWRASSQSRPQTFANEALTSHKQGTPGFEKWLWKTYQTQLEQIGSTPFECGSQRTLFRSQRMAIFLAGPECPAISRFLIVSRTGSGKTAVMHNILGKFHLDDMSKVVLVPTQSLATNFYKDVLNSKTLLSQFVRKALKLSTSGSLDAGQMNKYVPKLRTLLGVKNTTGPYQLKKYKQYLKKKTKGQFVPPYGTEEWSPGSPLRCESFASIARMFKETTDLAVFEAKLKTGDPCLQPQGSMESQVMFKPEYRYDQDGQKSWKGKLIKNPFDGKIIVMDEVHKLFGAHSSVSDTKLSMLRLMIQYARNAKVIGLTATPLVASDTTQSRVLDMIKGADPDTKNNEGYISYFNDLVYPLYPATVPHLFQTLAGSGVPVLGRLILSPLYGANRKKYIEKVRELDIDFTTLLENPDTVISPKELKRLHTYANTVYANGSKYKKQLLQNWESNANKLDCLHALLSSRKEKTLVLFGGGARSYMEYLKQKHPEQVMMGDEPEPLTKARRVGFMLASSDKTGKKQAKLLKWYNSPRNEDGKYVLHMCADAAEYGTGVDFIAPRRLVLVNVPHTITKYMQEIGRPMRACAYAFLKPEEQQVFVDVMVSTMDPQRTAQDIFDAAKFNQLIHHHQLGGDPVLTHDEIYLRKLFNTFGGFVKRMDTLIASHAVDRKWLQNLDVKKTRAQIHGTEPLVIQCNASQLVEELASKQPQAQSNMITHLDFDETLTSDTLTHALRNVKLPPMPLVPLDQDMTDITIKIHLSHAESHENAIERLVQARALGLLTTDTAPPSTQKQSNAIKDRANVRWRELQHFLPSIQRVVQLDFIPIASSNILLVLYKFDHPLELDHLDQNLDAIVSLVAPDQVGNFRHIVDESENAMPAINLQEEPNIQPEFQPNVLNQPIQYPAPPKPLESRPNQASTHKNVFVHMYFPDIRHILSNKIMPFAQYKHQTARVNGVLGRVKQVLQAYFRPHHKQIQVRNANGEIAAQVSNVPTQWLEIHKTTQNQLFDQLEHLDRLGSQDGWQIMPYNSKVHIDAAPAILQNVGFIEPRDVLAVNDGHVYLDQDTLQGRIQIKAAPAKMNDRVNTHAYAANTQYWQAKHQHLPNVHLTKTPPHQIAPTKAYANIHDFALRATTYEWYSFWRFVEEVRKKYEGPIFVSSNPVPTSGHFHLNISQDPGLPAQQLNEWREAQIEAEQVQRASKNDATPLYKEPPEQSKPISLPAIEMAEEVENPLISQKIQAKPPTDQVPIYLIVLLPGAVPQLVFVEQRRLGTFIQSLPVAHLSKQFVGTDRAVELTIQQSVQADALHIDKIVWLRKDSDPVAMVTLTIGSELNLFGMSPNGHFTGRFAFPVRTLDQLLPNVDGRSREILNMYRTRLEKEAF